MELSELNYDETYSYADYYKWQFDDRVELINGKIYKMTPAIDNLHQHVVENICKPLEAFLENKTIKVFHAPFEVKLSQGNNEDKHVKTIVHPDICILNETIHLDHTGCFGSPDIIMEVLTLGDNQKEIRVKFDVYEECGIKEYWIISPYNQTLTVAIFNNGKYNIHRTLAPGDTYATPIIEGYTFAVEDMFKNIKY